MTSNECLSTRTRYTQARPLESNSLGGLSNSFLDCKMSPPQRGRKCNVDAADMSNVCYQTFRKFGPAPEQEQESLLQVAIRSGYFGVSFLSRGFPFLLKSSESVQSCAQLRNKRVKSLSRGSECRNKFQKSRHITELKPDRKFR
jgi:hypothetical protein